MAGALEGLIVLDLTSHLSGPYAAMMLADHGADVIKVEPYAGDVMRRLPALYGGDLSSAFAQYNCGKRSIAVALKTAEGQDLARRLCGCHRFAWLPG